MSTSSSFCRAQESLQLARAADTPLENVRQISLHAARAWGKEALIAEQREERHTRARAVLAVAPAPDATPTADDQMVSENPDRGQATRANGIRLAAANN